MLTTDARKLHTEFDALKQDADAIVQTILDFPDEKTISDSCWIALLNVKHELETNEKEFLDTFHPVKLDKQSIAQTLEEAIAPLDFLFEKPLQLLGNFSARCTANLDKLSEFKKHDNNTDAIVLLFQSLLPDDDAILEKLKKWSDRFVGNVTKGAVIADGLLVSTPEFEDATPRTAYFARFFQDAVKAKMRSKKEKAFVPTKEETMVGILGVLKNISVEKTSTAARKFSTPPSAKLQQIEKLWDLTTVSKFKNSSSVCLTKFEENFKLSESTVETHVSKLSSHLWRVPKTQMDRYTVFWNMMCQCSIYKNYLAQKIKSHLHGEADQAIKITEKNAKKEVSVSFASRESEAMYRGSLGFNMLVNKFVDAEILFQCFNRALDGLKNAKWGDVEREVNIARQSYISFKSGLLEKRPVNWASSLCFLSPKSQSFTEQLDNFLLSPGQEEIAADSEQVVKVIVQSSDNVSLQKQKRP